MNYEINTKKRKKANNNLRQNFRTDMRLVSFGINHEESFRRDNRGSDFTVAI